MMTSMDHADKSGSARWEFLRALYAEAPPELYLELRCIHPGTGEVRALWSQMSNKRQLTRIFNQADVLNREGFGIHFAPCLRHEKSGKADAAALAPALWVDVDCNGDPIQRERGLETLRTFDPAPSFILDSGGGLHGYWLLDAPYALNDSECREKIAGLLRGLSSVLGGDPAYVKSTASLMRLPGSINTKPERNGAVVTIIEAHPARRYPLTRFTWLEVQPRIEKVGPKKVIVPNGNGHHPLPKRTEDYLVSGAPNGSRNTELFAAACQMRDAGYTQAEAAHQLIPRHVASGSSEREAHATIASAFDQLPREPIPQPQVLAQERIQALISRYDRSTSEAERPSAAQIREAVRACAALDSLEWAEQRKRLKAVFGDVFKIDDLNQMYKQARREQERVDIPQVVNSPRYVELEGAIVFEKPTERGTMRQQVADWSARIVEWLIQVNDDGQSENVMRVTFQHGAHSATLNIPSELFGDPNALQRFIARKAGAIYTVAAGMPKHLPPAINHLSGAYPTRTTYGFMGWTRTNDQWMYVSPAASVDGDGMMASPPEVELESRLRDYRLTTGTWEEALAVFNAAIDVFPKNLAPALIAFTLLPVLYRFFPAAAPKPALHLVGTTGSGKSEIAAIMTSFYGGFTRDTPPAQWGDTVNTVEALGYSLADALYWVDDYKACYADERTFTRFLQSYSREMGRGRLTREAKLRQDRPCRGLLLSTGETTIEGEASILSRMLVLEVPPWEKRDPRGQSLAKAEALREHLPSFTAHFINWIAAQAQAGTFSKDLANRFAGNAQGYQEKLAAQGQRAHTGRVAKNWAVLVSVFQLLHQFLMEKDADGQLPLWQDGIVETIRSVQEERASHIFSDLLGQLLAGGQCVIDDDMRHPRDYPSATIVVGYRNEGLIYLMPDIALREINKTHPLKFTKSAIGNQLREDGWLLPGANHLTVQRSVRGHVIRFWRLKSEILGC